MAGFDPVQSWLWTGTDEKVPEVWSGWIWIETGQCIIEPGADVAKHDVVLRVNPISALPQGRGSALNPMPPTGICGLGGDFPSHISTAMGGEGIEHILSPENAKLAAEFVLFDAADQGGEHFSRLAVWNKALK